MKKSLLLCALSFFSLGHTYTYYDEVNFSLAGSYTKFDVDAPSKHGEHYTSLNPSIGFQWYKTFSDKFSLLLDVDADYDADIYSQYNVQSGSFDAHSFSADLQFIAGWKVFPEYGIHLGLGTGVGSFWLKAYIMDDVEYDPKPYYYAPIVEIKKDYTFAGMKGQAKAQWSYIDCYYFNGHGYASENTLYYSSTPTMKHGLITSYRSWGMDLHGAWKYQRQSFRVGYVLAFI